MTILNFEKWFKLKKKSSTYFKKISIKTYFEHFGPGTVLKDNNTVKPIVSMIGTQKYILSKFLEGIIKPYIPPTLMLKLNKQFLDPINSFQYYTN